MFQLLSSINVHFIFSKIFTNSKCINIHSLFEYILVFQYKYVFKKISEIKSAWDFFLKLKFGKWMNCGIEKVLSVLSNQNLNVKKNKKKIAIVCELEPSWSKSLKICLNPRQSVSHCMACDSKWHCVCVYNIYILKELKNHKENL